jgi:MFS family permease
MMIAGFIGGMLLTFHLALVDYDTSGWWIALNMFLRGMSFGLLIIPIQAATFATIRPEDTGRASSIFNVGRQVAASLGVAILATVLATRLTDHNAILGDPATREAALAAFHDAFIFAGCMCILGILASFLIDDEKAAHAMKTEMAEPVEAVV